MIQFRRQDYQLHFIDKIKRCEYEKEMGKT